MKIGSKARVVLAFSSRLPYVTSTSSLPPSFFSLSSSLSKSGNMLTIFRVAILSLVYLHYVTTFVDASNVGVAITVAIVLQQWEICYSLTSTTIPTLKTFIRGFDTGMGFDFASTLSQQGHGSKRYGSGMYNSFNGNSGLYELKSISKDGVASTRTTKRLEGSKPQSFRPDLIEHTASIVHPDHRRSASADRSHMTENSQEMFIHHSVDFQVHSN
jgi:hypothetical protein